MEGSQRLLSAHLVLDYQAHDGPLPLCQIGARARASQAIASGSASPCLPAQVAPEAVLDRSRLTPAERTSIDTQVGALAKRVTRHRIR